MNGIEGRGKKRAQKRNFKKAVLQTIAAAGVLGVALVAPNVLGAAKKLGIPLMPSDSSAIQRARIRLVSNGFLTFEGNLLRLTSKGEKALQRLQIFDRTRRVQRWDGRWRVLIFDIPEFRKTIREKIRLTLKSVGFQRLQDSVWIYPYDCEALITLLKADLKIGKDVLYMIVDELEYDKPIRKLFGL